MKILFYSLITLILVYSCTQPQTTPQQSINPTSVQSDSALKFRPVNNVFNASSPTIAKLKKLSKTDRIKAVNDLIANHRESGLPLVENDSTLDGYVYATFMHLDPSHLHDITFNIFGIYDEYRFGDKKLYRLAGTDLYYRTYMIPDDLCFSYRFYRKNRKTGQKTKLSDTLNHDLIPTGPRKQSSWSALDLSPPKDVWYKRKIHQQYGTIDTLKLSSKLLSNTRDLYVYLPPGYGTTNNNYPIIYLFDPSIYLNRVEVPNVLDNLIQANVIDPMIAVFIDNPSQSSRSKELPLNPKFREFMSSELVPFIKSRYEVTDKPDKTVIGGISYGGLAATYIAFEHDEIFGKVLSQSGSFWRDTALTENGSDWIRGDYLTSQFLAEPNRNLKIHLDWGLQENWCKGSGRRMAQVLHDKQYEFQFKEFNGWHDWSNSRKIFPEALVYLLED